MRAMGYLQILAIAKPERFRRAAWHFFCKEARKEAHSKSSRLNPPCGSWGYPPPAKVLSDIKKPLSPNGRGQEDLLTNES